jgi:hypothetical protein
VRRCVRLTVWARGGSVAEATMRIRCVGVGPTGWRSDPRRTYARFAASGFSAVLLGVGVGGCASAHGPRADGLRPARTNTALIATAGIPTMVAAWMPAWSHDPAHRLGSHDAHRATQHPPLVRSPTSAVRATIAPRVTAPASTPAASPTGPVYSGSVSWHSKTRWVTAADGATTKITTTATTRTVDGNTTQTTRTQTTITPPRAGTRQ